MTTKEDRIDKVYKSCGIVISDFTHNGIVDCTASFTADLPEIGFAETEMEALLDLRAELLENINELKQRVHAVDEAIDIIKE